ncbi:hypothetical protein [Moheibacter sediminis]|uniref:Beta-ketoacyl synthase, N-terminal domain n=1 Tax=Moheibacter sediminis TaxID=1434700 RepID=A0A1W1YEW5_9FLAO|nr:hypothetical protein [Moheibacter sediminis]SMC34683.1 hypothetical protein SAMN06296427_101317 [Moheibacter sediminis]
MITKTYIKSYCQITNNKIICDDEVILERNNSESIDEFLKRIYQKSEANYPKYHKMDLLCKATFLAAEFISKKENIYETETALVFSNHSSSMISDEKHALSIYGEESTASPAVFVYTLPNIALGEMSIRHKLLSENVFFIFDKFTPEFLVPYAEQNLNDKKSDLVLAGWAEIDENDADVFLYLVSKEGALEHNEENLNNLYLKK